MIMKELKIKANAIKEELSSLEIVRECYDVRMYNYCYDNYIIELSEKDQYKSHIFFSMSVMEVILKHELTTSVENIGDGKNYMRINIWIKK